MFLFISILWITSHYNLQTWLLPYFAAAVTEAWGEVCCNWRFFGVHGKRKRWRRSKSFWLVECQQHSAEWRGQQQHLPAAKFRQPKLECMFLSCPFLFMIFFDCLTSVGPRHWHRQWQLPCLKREMREWNTAQTSPKFALVWGSCKNQKLEKSWRPERDINLLWSVMYTL